jgi:hypothetical protein
MFKSESYQAKQFNLSGLHGISDRTLEMHFKLYEGYVKETNRLINRKNLGFLEGWASRSGGNASLLRTNSPSRL